MTRFPAFAGIDSRDCGADHARVRMLDLTPEEWTAVRLSLRIALVATIVSLPFGIAIAWLMARPDSSWASRSSMR